MRILNMIVLALLLAPFAALPALAQDTASESQTSTTTTTETSSEWISDWRLWAVVGALLVVILVRARSREGSRPFQWREEVSTRARGGGRRVVPARRVAQQVSFHRNVGNATCLAEFPAVRPIHRFLRAAERPMPIAVRL
jgi:hypothetical protein